MNNNTMLLSNHYIFQDYTGLFEVSTNVEDNLDDILTSKSAENTKKERPSFSSTERKINLANFSTNQVFQFILLFHIN